RCRPVLPYRSPAPENALWPESSRSGNDRGSHWPVIRGCASGWLSPGTPRHARRSHRRAAVRINHAALGVTWRSAAELVFSAAIGGLFPRDSTSDRGELFLPALIS